MNEILPDDIPVILNCCKLKYVELKDNNGNIINPDNYISVVAYGHHLTQYGINHKSVVLCEPDKDDRKILLLRGMKLHKKVCKLYNKEDLIKQFTEYSFDIKRYPCYVYIAYDKHDKPYFDVCYPEDVIGCARHVFDGLCKE